MKQIFIVEDNDTYSIILDYMLSSNSVYQFVRFSSGEECIANLYMNPDIIILDYELPGMNGYETLLQIKENNPDTHVIVLTNSLDNELADEMRNAGAYDYISKKAHGEEQILRRIEDILNEEEAHLFNPFRINKNFLAKFLS